MIIMVVLGAALVVLIGLTITAANQDWDGLEFATIFLIIGVGITLVILAYGWVSAEVKAGIINREYKTNYTQEEVFFGSGVIDTIRQLDRKRIEVNGDLIRGGAR